MLLITRLIFLDEERAAKQSEVTLLMDEVERAQTRLLSLEREKVFFHYILPLKDSLSVILLEKNVLLLVINVSTSLSIGVRISHKTRRTKKKNLKF